MIVHWDVTANATNTVLVELLVAARTDEKLRATLQEVLAEYAVNIGEIAKALPGADQFSEDTFGAVVAIVTNAFELCRDRSCCVAAARARGAADSSC